MDQIEKTIQLLKNQIEDEKKKVEEKSVQIELEKKDLEEEKKRMSKIVKQDDVLRINVGGKIFDVKRSTLCQIKGSLLESMFSGRWDDKWEKDVDGYPFFDWDPIYFKRVLEHLRAKLIVPPDTVISLPRDNQNNLFDMFLDYIGLNEIMEKKPKEQFSITLRSPSIVVSDNGLSACSSKQGHGYVFGCNQYSGKDRVTFEFQIVSMQDNNWMFVGICPSQIMKNTDGNNSYSWKGVYGWATNYHYSNGNYLQSNNDMKTGDKVEMTLDCPQNTLTLVNKRSNIQHTLKIDNSKEPWVMHVNLHGMNDTIQLLSVKYY